MTSDRTRSRTLVVGMVATVAWLVDIACFAEPDMSGLCPFTFIIAWAFTAAWVAVDAADRSLKYGLWTLLAIVTGPLGFLIYLLSRPPLPTRCGRCGNPVSSTNQRCPTCGFESLFSRARQALNSVASSFAESLASGSSERARHTTRSMAIALIAFGVFCRAVMLNHGSFAGLFGFGYVLSVAAYWVLVAWWVYLDASWRRMDAIPWAVLTLVTNVFGLVTYLVVRYPDPRACPQCHAPLAIGLQRCPYCGGEAEPACPRCQASVKPDWVYCPACAAQLPSAAPVSPVSQAAVTWSVRGTVLDAATNAPIANAEVTIDSKTAARATTTDSLGGFVLANLEPRPYVLVATAEGYTIEAKAFTPGGSGSARVHFSLQARLADIPGFGVWCTRQP